MLKPKITHPKNNTKVAHEVRVTGIATGMVQLYVLANDGKWYLQPPVSMVKKSWSGTCFLGNLVTPGDSKFTVAAVLTTERPKTPLAMLPNVQMDKIKVKLKK